VLLNEDMKYQLGGGVGGIIPLGGGGSHILFGPYQKAPISLVLFDFRIAYLNLVKITLF